MNETVADQVLRVVGVHADADDLATPPPDTESMRSDKFGQATGTKKGQSGGGVLERVCFVIPNFVHQMSL